MNPAIISTNTSSAEAIYIAAALEALRPPPQMSVSEWSDHHRILSSRSSAEPNNWRTSRTPYLKEIMDALTPQSRYERVVFAKGAQIGGTEAGLNWLAWIIDRCPGPVLCVQPTTDMAKRLSKQRLDPMIEACPVLQSRVKDR